MAVGAEPSGTGTAGDHGLPRCSVVVPLFNEADNLAGLAEALTSHFPIAETEFVLVDDGSTDSTGKLLDGIANALPLSRTIRFPVNRGKGAAVRAGMLAATGRTRLFMDADLATDLSGVQPLLDALDTADAAIGSRSLLGSRVTGATPLRTLMGRSFSVIGRTVAGSGVRDSQCGFKAFRGEVADVVFRLARVDGFAFDVEILRLLRVLDYRLVEVPVVWTARSGSSVRLVRDSAQTLVDTVRIRFHPGRRQTLVRARALGWKPPPVLPSVRPSGQPEPLGG